MSDANKAAVRRFVDELFIKGNLDVVDELVADDYVDHTPPPDLPPGKPVSSSWPPCFGTPSPTWRSQRRT